MIIEKEFSEHRDAAAYVFDKTLMKYDCVIVIDNKLKTYCINRIYDNAWFAVSRKINRENYAEPVTDIFIENITVYSNLSLKNIADILKKEKGRQCITIFDKTHHMMCFSRRIISLALMYATFSLLTIDINILLKKY